jgi:TetR/AcrR family transcriptional regulator, regulator of biofilm formation and stress response
MAGVSHRAVAARAGVSLSATTYYFSSLADLEHAAFTEHYTRRIADYRAAGEALRGLDLSATEITRGAADLLASSSIGLLSAHFEVYLNAGRRSDLRDALQPVFAAMSEVMAQVAERLGVRDIDTFVTAAIAVIEGVQIRRVAQGISGHTEIARSLEMLLTGALADTPDNAYT